MPLVSQIKLNDMWAPSRWEVKSSHISLPSRLGENAQDIIKLLLPSYYLKETNLMSTDSTWPPDKTGQVD
jgi:hypothetical protein